jgi:hypothetical protein
MLLALLQFGAVAATAVYLIHWITSLRHRNARSWNSLLARLRPDWSARELSDHFLWTDKLNSTPDETWKGMHGAEGLWAMYQNARVMMEMADFATRNCDAVDPLLLESLRSDAMHIRLFVLLALAQYAFNVASEPVRVNAFRAAQLYVGMSARMMQLLQENAAGVVPDFVAAM